ncbi:PQQ-binding-like beta-propeller repeat protein [Actinoplanes sp. NPDC023936]|uniref:outer membrane protein assembly factor BamB family protein n=1 Tax=Actinoplanes sp. NPDC023936 TaxID=3154910 RepID=UPI0033E37A07
MTVIELGEYNVPIEPDPPARPEFNPRNVRRFLLAGVVLACLLLLGAGGPHAAPLVRDVWSVPMTDQDSMSVRGDGIFLLRDTGAGRVRLTAYEPATGAVRWARESAGIVSWMRQGEEAGLLLIPGDEKLATVEFEDGSQGQVAWGINTTALDSRTGRQLWKTAGEAQAAAATSVLLAERDSSGNYVSVRLVDARTGAEIWQRPAGGALHLIVKNEGPSPTLIVLASNDGRATVLRYADGSLIAQKKLPWSAGSDDDDTYLSVVEDLVLVSRNYWQRAVVTAYRTGSLERLWETETGAYSYVSECGPVLCITDGALLRGLDPRTGREVWNRSGASGGAAPVGDRLIASDGADPPAQVVLDPATGEQIGSGGIGWLMRYEAYQNSVVLLHRIYDQGPLRDAVDHLDLTTGEITRVGQLQSSADVQQGWRCDSTGRYLACQRDALLVITAVG